MSMISDLVKKLRWIADYDQYQNRNSEVTIRKAADTIEMLSQKARATEQGWIPCSERLPEEEGNYLVTFGAFAETINGEKVIFGDIDGSVAEIGYGCYARDIFGQLTAFGWYDLYTATPYDKRAIIAWTPLPKPWKGADDDQ